MRDDAGEILDRLTNELERVLDRFWGGWIKRGNVAYPVPKNKTDLGSFVVYLGGQTKYPRGKWFRSSAGIGGDALNLFAYGESGSTSHKASGETFQRAREFLGMRDEQPDPEGEKRRAEEARRRQEQRDRDERAAQLDAQRKAETAQGVWAQGKPISGTLAEKYLTERGVPTPPQGWPDVLRFHPGLLWRDPDYEGPPKAWPTYPCLIGNVQDVADETVSVWRIFIDPATFGKAPVSKPKLGLGPSGGGAVRIGGVGPRIGMAEGLETALAAWTLEGYRFPVWAATSTSGMTGFEPPLGIERISIYPDGDLPTEEKGKIRAPPGMSAATKMRARMSEIGIPTIINEPPFNGDYLDVLKELLDLEHGKA